MTLVCFIVFLTSLVFIQAQDVNIPIGDKRPGGITRGPGASFLVSEFFYGGVKRINGKTMKVRQAVESFEFTERAAAGLDYAKGAIWVAGAGPGPVGNPDLVPAIHVYDVSSGDEIVSCPVDGGINVDDIVVVDRSAFAIESYSNAIYMMDVSDALEGRCTVTTITIGPDPFLPDGDEPVASGILAYKGGLIVGTLSGDGIHFIDVKREKQYQIISGDEAPSVSGLFRIKNVMYGSINGRVLVWNLSFSRGVVSAIALDTIESDLFANPSSLAKYMDDLWVTNQYLDEDPADGTYAITKASLSARQDCFFIYEITSYEGGTMGGVNFNGRFVGSETQAFDTPFFYSYDDAFAAAVDESSGEPDGRTIGAFDLFSKTGIWSFQFFEDDSWITTSYGFVVGPNAVTGGSGGYLGMTGTVQSVRVLEETEELPYKIDRFELCPLEPPTPLDLADEPTCVFVFEITSYEGGTLGGFDFNGRFVGNETQAFDTPFYYTYDAAFAAAVNETGVPDGRTIGAFNLFPATGIWSFEFFDDGSWLTSSYGFILGPNVVTGGSGRYIDSVGTIESVRVLQETPELPYKIDRFELCLY